MHKTLKVLIILCSHITVHSHDTSNSSGYAPDSSTTYLTYHTPISTINIAGKSMDSLGLEVEGAASKSRRRLGEPWRRAPRVVP